MLTASTAPPLRSREQLDAYLKQIERPRNATIAKLGRELDLFIFQEEGPGVGFWHAKGWRCSVDHRLHARRSPATTTK